MNLKNLKLLIIGAFLAFAVSVFFFINNAIKAQTNETTRKKAEIIEKVAAYKTWKQITKPAEKSESKIFTIADSSPAG